MTYCLAINTDAGLVFCSDSRTNAGADMLSTHSKMHVYDLASDQIVVLLSAGNLATTQSVIDQIDSDLKQHETESLHSCGKMADIAKYVARVSREHQEQARDSTGDAEIDTSATFIVGGQIHGCKPTIYLIYAAGNYISVSNQTPYLQIGESKYGKPILDRILGPDTGLDDAARCALVSMDSTMSANGTVGPPIEVLVYESDSFECDHYVKLTAEDPYLQSLRKSWGEAVQKAFRKLPLFEWEEHSTVNLHAITEQRKPS